MKKCFSMIGRAFSLGAVALAALSAWAEEPGVVILYNDGTTHTHAIAAVTRMDIGTDEVTMVSTAGEEKHRIADIDRIKVGDLVSAVKELPAEAEAALWPTVVAGSFNVLPAADTEITVHDLNGRLVAGPIKAAGGSSLSVDASALAKGHYIVSFGGKSVRIIKQ
ncbi:MAG: T9SS type A sorting domain-containing protein [Muribaculaceae bacterium]|nr:T9SS type A sorting domain-containing protein [Muribaculaceae bacterium]